MTKLCPRSRWRWFCALASLCTALRAQPEDPGAKAAMDAVHERLRALLVLSPGLPVDADLRSAAQAMFDAELPRMRPRLSAWLQEERRLQPKAQATDQILAVALRAHNEMSLWQLDSAGPEHDRWRQQAWAQPRSCDLVGTRTPADRLLRAWQQVPREQRSAFLAAEASLLQRWGEPRAPLPPRPAPSVADEAWRAIDAHVAKATPLPAPLSPMLAWRLLSEDAAANRSEVQVRCGVRQWALDTALQRGQGRLGDAEWLAHRYARMPQHDDWFAAPDGGTGAATDFPELARRFGIEARVTVEFDADAQGRVVDPVVQRRELQVPGIRGQRPVAFETMFDDASLARLAQLPGGRAGDARPGRRSVELVFKLEP